MDIKLVVLMLMAGACAIEAVPVQRQKRFSFDDFMTNVLQRLERAREDFNRGVDEAETSFRQTYQQIREDLQGHADTLSQVFQTINDQVSGHVDRAGDFIGGLTSSRQDNTQDIAVD